jgi:hypothetical protein
MTNPDYRALCAELVKTWDATADFDFNDFGHAAADIVTRARAALAQPEPVAPTVIGPEWQPCVKLPITVHVREQRPGETHSSTREGITPLRPDDLIMRGVQGEEYPIGRELFNQTYRMGAALAQPEPMAPTDEEIMELMPQPMRDDLATAARALAKLVNHASTATYRIVLNRHAVDHARAVLAKWGGQ